MIFATDLDRTMIYSNRLVDEENIKNFKQIENVNGKHFSYISNEALKDLIELNNLLYVIPTTTRSIEQFKRISTFDFCEYAVTTNGGTILHNGEILNEWEVYIEKILVKYIDKFEEIMNLLDNQNFITIQPKLLDNKFIFAKTDDVDKCEETLNKLIDGDLWDITIQGQKVYIIPKGMTKSVAINFLKRRIGAKKIIAAGDGKLDKDLLDAADIAILPEHGELYYKYNYKKDKLITVNKGIYSADEIIKIVFKIYKGGINYAI